MPLRDNSIKKRRKKSKRETNNGQMGFTIQRVGDISTLT